MTSYRPDKTLRPGWTNWKRRTYSKWQSDTWNGMLCHSQSDQNRIWPGTDSAWNRFRIYWRNSGRTNGGNCLVGGWLNTWKRARKGWTRRDGILCLTRPSPHLCRHRPRMTMRSSSPSTSPTTLPTIAPTPTIPPTLTPLDHHTTVLHSSGKFLQNPCGGLGELGTALLASRLCILIINILPVVTILCSSSLKINKYPTHAKCRFLQTTWIL